MDAGIADFDPEQHLGAVMALCRAEGWSSYADDPGRTARALTAPGVLCLVALHGGEVVGVLQAQTDGAIQAHLSLLVVAPHVRGRGVGRCLLSEALARCGARRMDLLADEAAIPFYNGFAHRRMPGYRLYPSVPGR